MRATLFVALLAVCLIALQCIANAEDDFSHADRLLSEVPPPPTSGSPPEHTANSGPGGTGERTDLPDGPAAAPVTTTTTTPAKTKHKPPLEGPSARQTQQQPQQPQQPHGPSNNANNAVEELPRQDNQTEIQRRDPNYSNKAPPPPEPHGEQKKDTVQDTDKEQPCPISQTTSNATVAAGKAPNKGNSASSKDPKAPADKHPEAPSQVHNARDTNVNLPKGQALLHTHNDDNPVVDDTAKALNTPAEPNKEAPTDITKGTGASGVTSAKLTPSTPKENEPAHSQPLTVSSLGDKGRSSEITPPMKMFLHHLHRQKNNKSFTSLPQVENTIKHRHQDF